LFNPFARLCGPVSVAMLTMHGAAWLACKTEDAVQSRARRAAMICGVVLAVLLVIGGMWGAQINGYVVQSFAGVDAPPNPLTKQVARQHGALMSNFRARPVAAAVPALVIVCALLAALLSSLGRSRGPAFVISGLSVASVIATAGISLFPFLLHSSIDPNSSLLVRDASSSAMALLG
jgi:cytochrome bd ubiquinol oxidase subunit II